MFNSNTLILLLPPDLTVLTAPGNTEGHECPDILIGHNSLVTHEKPYSVYF